MLGHRLWLVGFILVLVTVPILSWVEITESSRRFEEEQQRMIQKYGSAEGLYGDCSGATVIIPVVLSLYSILMLIWSAVILAVSGSLGNNAVKIQIIIIGIIGVVPAALYLQLVIRSLVYHS